jgi:hypothetical protein
LVVVSSKVQTGLFAGDFNAFSIDATGRDDSNAVGVLTKDVRRPRYSILGVIAGMIIGIQA